MLTSAGQPPRKSFTISMNISRRIGIMVAGLTSCSCWPCSDVDVTTLLLDHFSPQRRLCSSTRGILNDSILVTKFFALSLQRLLPCVIPMSVFTCPHSSPSTPESNGRSHSPPSLHTMSSQTDLLGPLRRHTFCCFEMNGPIADLENGTNLTGVSLR